MGSGPGMMAGPGMQVQTFSRGGGAAPSAADMEKMRADADVRLKEAEAKRRVVEYRLFYADYKAVNGVKIPMRIQKMVDGNATEEISFDQVKFNGKIDARTFQVTKSEK